MKKYTTIIKNKNKVLIKHKKMLNLTKMENY